MNDEGSFAKGFLVAVTICVPFWTLVVLLLAGCTEIVEVECLAVVFEGDTIGFIAADTADALAVEHCPEEMP